ncbi:uncharacterized protein LOC106647031 [Copidosoma floridanum]|uniref:uncharacterized protein LOC106647031 n=1 Tax=Copidosoma floridanum TaxID=29053 RepID=UPI0006C9C2DD|nr:uncharacterized protein LOC106647031 [Copidosoma floridanum]
MKSACLLVVLALIVCLFNSVEAQSREKRALSLEYCPTGYSEKECRVYAWKKLKESGGCQTFHLGGNTIQWESCGAVLCPPGAEKPGDNRKPYPDCCPSCY